MNLKVPPTQPKVICAVYHLMLGAEVMYVGQSINVYTRLGAWNVAPPIQCPFNFDGYRIFPCSRARLCALERKHIMWFKPVNNIRAPLTARRWGRAVLHHRQRHGDAAVRGMRGTADDG
jgi:hypothetical protein